MAHFDVPRNLSHAGTVARRLKARVCARLANDHSAGSLFELLDELCETLEIYEGTEEPEDEEAEPVVRESAELGRRLVDELEALSAGEDRTGQLVRNLFECLGLGEEGASISLRAGENPGSLMRPV